MTDRPGAFSEAGVSVSAERNGAGWSLRGRTSFVLHGDVADLLVVVARCDAGSSVFVVDADDAGVSRRSEPVLDQTRHLATIDFDGAAGRLVGGEGRAWPALDSVLDRAAVALACDALGVAQRSLDLTVRYAIDRYQFGRPIGSFQAIKHKCADMVVAVELARSAVCYATRALDSGADDARLLPPSHCRKRQKRPSA